jgi:spore coat polysaccharide biosynthesis protein SpsF (cytidylyltransferase family)
MNAQPTLFASGLQQTRQVPKQQIEVRHSTGIKLKCDFVTDGSCFKADQVRWKVAVREEFKMGQSLAIYLKEVQVVHSP